MVAAKAAQGQQQAPKPAVQDPTSQLLIGVLVKRVAKAVMISPGMIAAAADVKAAFAAQFTALNAKIAADANAMMTVGMWLAVAADVLSLTGNEAALGLVSTEPQRQAIFMSEWLENGSAINVVCPAGYLEGAP